VACGSVYLDYLDLSLSLSVIFNIFVVLGFRDVRPVPGSCR